jgi:hypothetical protein
LRDEGLTIFASVAEAVEIAEKAAIPVVLNPSQGHRKTHVGEKQSNLSYG